MVAKSQIKLITSLSKKKYRQEHGLFVAEGVKAIKELLDSSLELHSLYVLAESESLFKAEANLIDAKSLKKISFLKTPQQALAVFKIPQPIASASVKESFTLVLDDVRDPGNLGTIIRLCDWFGIKDLVCSPETVDCYNPKVVQATMGSLSRVNLNYENLDVFLDRQKLPIYGAFMNGTNCYEEDLAKDAILLLGNEARGISKELESHIENRLSIPQFGTSTAESLNVAIAGAILVSRFKAT